MDTSYTGNTFAGFKVFVSRPVLVTIKRTWKERLFTRPWRPFKATRVIMQPATIPENECYLFGNEIHCGDRFYQNIEKEELWQKNSTIARKKRNQKRK